MKNLKKLSKGELKIINGGIQACEQWMEVCPCRSGYKRCTSTGPCVPANQLCL